MDFVEIVRISVIYFTIFRKSLLKFQVSQEPGREAEERDVVRGEQHQQVVVAIINLKVFNEISSAEIS